MEFISFKQQFKSLRLALIVMFIALSLNACNSFDKAMSVVVPFYEYDKTELDAISVLSTSDANNNLPVAIDLVFVLDEKTAMALMNLNGPQWFDNKNGLMLRYKQTLIITQVEIVPQTTEQQIDLPEDYDDAVRVFMYANYIHSKGQFMADLTLYDEAQISLQKTGYSVKELNP